MSQSNPNPEERQRIVAAALKSSRLSSAEKKDDLTLLFERFEQCRQEVISLMAPMTELVLTNSSIHTVAGRRDYENTATKFLLDKITQHGFSRDEVMMLLAFTHARLITNEVA